MCGEKNTEKKTSPTPPPKKQNKTKQLKKEKHV